MEYVTLNNKLECPVVGIGAFYELLFCLLLKNMTLVIL